MVAPPGLPGVFPQADWYYPFDDFLVLQREDSGTIAPIDAHALHLLKSWWLNRLVQAGLI